jgi:hypothetical protein
MPQVWLSRLRFAPSCRKAITVLAYRSLFGSVQGFEFTHDLECEVSYRLVVV